MLPERFRWLEQIGALPKLVSAALQYLGIKEIPGSQSNPAILDMARGLGISNIYHNDDMAWCGLFMSHLFRITGKPPLDYHNDRYNILRAKYYVNWGHSVEVKDVRLGSVVILDREGGGHICLFLAFTPNGFLGIGGNQSNSVTISEFSLDRIVGVREYYATAAPESAKQYHVSSTGKLSTNEA